MSNTPPLTLYLDGFWISPYAYTAFVALREKGLPFETVTVALHEGAQRRPEYQAQSITGRIPALTHGDFWLTESSAIVEYLEETFPAPGYTALLPSEPRARARARQILSWLRSDLAGLREERPTTTMFYERAKNPLSKVAQPAAAKLIAACERLLTPGTTTLFGKFSIADADLAFMLQRLVASGDPVPPHLRDFANGIWERPSVRDFVNRKRPAYVAY
jgi:glutathione S-transferase